MSPLFFLRGAEALGRLGRNGLLALVRERCRSLSWVLEVLDDPAFGEVAVLGLFRLRYVHLAQDVDVPAVLVALRRPRVNHDRGEVRAVARVFVHPEETRDGPSFRVDLRVGDAVPWWGWEGVGAASARLGAGVDGVLVGDLPEVYVQRAAAAVRPVPKDPPPPSWSPEATTAGGSGCGSSVPASPAAAGSTRRR